MRSGEKFRPAASLPRIPGNDFYPFSRRLPNAPEKNGSLPAFPPPLPHAPKKQRSPLPSDAERGSSPSVHAGEPLFDTGLNRMQRGKAGTERFRSDGHRRAKVRKLSFLQGRHQRTHSARQAPQGASLRETRFLRGTAFEKNTREMHFPEVLPAASFRRCFRPPPPNGVRKKPP